MTAIIILALVVAVLLAVTIILFWYNRKVVEQWVAMVEDVKYVQKRAQEYGEHLKIVLSMDTYTGEPVIENLLKHSGDFASDLEDFQTIYSFDPDAEPPSQEEIANEEEED